MAASFEKIQAALDTVVVATNKSTVLDNSMLTIGSDEAPFRNLLNRATEALAKEDRWLNRAFKRSKHADAYKGRAATGLGYWVFEHNLVFAIFREWLVSHRVLWDEMSTAGWPSPHEYAARPSGEPDKSPRMYIDLQVLDDDSGRRLLFEAKWFHAGSAQSAADDGKRLRDLCGSNPSLSGYLLLFVRFEDATALQTDVLAPLSDKGMKPSFAGVFRTSQRYGVEGYFGVLAVPVNEG